MDLKGPHRPANKRWHFCRFGIGVGQGPSHSCTAPFMGERSRHRNVGGFVPGSGKAAKLLWKDKTYGGTCLTDSLRRLFGWKSSGIWLERWGWPCLHELTVVHWWDVGVNSSESRKNATWVMVHLKQETTYDLIRWREQNLGYDNKSYGSYVMGTL